MTQNNNVKLIKKQHCAFVFTLILSFEVRRLLYILCILVLSYTVYLGLYLIMYVIITKILKSSSNKILCFFSFFL